MIHANRLDKSSAVFFVIGFILAKAQYLPLPFFTGILDILSLSLYLVGYLLWASAAILFPRSENEAPPFLGVKEFKGPYFAAAVLGIIGTLVCFVGTFLPILVIPAVWIYVLANCTWCFSEIHKLLFPPFWHLEFPREKQIYHLTYTSLFTFVSLISAVGTTVAFFMPLFITEIIIVAAVVGVVIGGIALAFWLAHILVEPDKKRFTYLEIIAGLNDEILYNENKSFYEHSHSQELHEFDEFILTSDTSNDESKSSYALNQKPISLLNPIPIEAEEEEIPSASMTFN